MEKFFRCGRKFALLLSLLAQGGLSLSPSPVHADETFTFVVKKQEEKAKTRWSLQEWLETRDRMRLMDLWLALHSPSPYEFYLGGAYQTASAPGVANTTGWDFHAGAFASIFGLELRRDPQSDWLGLFRLRVFGYHDQSTNITLEGGIRQDELSGATSRGAVAGGSMAVYLGKHFGLTGLYRYDFASQANAAGASSSGYRWEGGAFIDFAFVRIFGNYYQNPETFTTSSGSSATTTSGATLGTRLYF